MNLFGADPGLHCDWGPTRAFRRKRYDTAWRHRACSEELPIRKPRRKPSFWARSGTRADDIPFARLEKPKTLELGTIINIPPSRPVLAASDTMADPNPRLTEAAYQALPGGPLEVNKALYDRIGATGEASSLQTDRRVVNDFILPIRSGKAWTVKAGQVCRIIAAEGAQVGDLNMWYLHNPRERFWASRTRQLQRAHVSIYDRLWSCLPYLRPLCTITGNSLAGYGTGGNGKGGGKDAEGGRVHDLLGTVSCQVSHSLTALAKTGIADISLTITISAAIHT